jgi:hypothetical protein
MVPVFGATQRPARNPYGLKGGPENELGRWNAKAASEAHELIRCDPRQLLTMSESRNLAGIHTRILGHFLCVAPAAFERSLKPLGQPGELGRRVVVLSFSLLRRHALPECQGFR